MVNAKYYNSGCSLIESRAWYHRNLFMKLMCCFVFRNGEIERFGKDQLIVGSADVPSVEHQTFRSVLEIVKYKPKIVKYE